MIKSAMRQALRESLLGKKKEMRNSRAKSHVKDDEDEEDDEVPTKNSMHEADESKKEKVEEGEDDGWRDEQKSFMKNKVKPNKSKTAIVIAVPGPSKKFGKANFAKKG